MILFIDYSLTLLSVSISIFFCVYVIIYKRMIPLLREHLIEHRQAFIILS